MEIYKPTDRLYKPVQTQLKPFVASVTATEQDHAAAQVQAQIHQLVTQPHYPCVAALKSYHKDDYQVGFYGKLGSEEAAAQLRNDLLFFLQEQKRTRSTYLSFWAIFDEEIMTEEIFEQALWQELSLLTSEEQRATDWGPGTVSDPENPLFRFSLVGSEFFVVGLHKNSSRVSRQFDRPVLIFNVWEQFAELMRIGQYDSMVQVNRKRDEKFQGSPNPMAVAHGDHWESIQFSGRDNSKQWKCPFAFLKKLKKPAAV